MRTRPLLALLFFTAAACGGMHDIGDVGQESRIGKPCGGIAGLGCGPNQVCADDPSDDCDPQKGGADCGGICQCAPVLCALHCEHGYQRDAAGCETCRCNDPGPGPGGPRCGPTTCAAGEECCNESCGICVKPGGACILLACGPDAGGTPCGPNICPAGQTCCNESCGICAPPGGACTTQVCAPKCSSGPPPNALCAQHCTAGYKIVAGEVTCQCCDAPSCPPVVCALACPNGFKKGADGCDICACEDARTPVTAHCIRNRDDACKTDADCIAGGCGGELCHNPASGAGGSTCDCGAPQGVGCGCVAGRCTWYR